MVPGKGSLIINLLCNIKLSYFLLKSSHLGARCYGVGWDCFYLWCFVKILMAPHLQPPLSIPFKDFHEHWRKKSSKYLKCFAFVLSSTTLSFHFASHLMKENDLFRWSDDFYFFRLLIAQVVSRKKEFSHFSREKFFILFSLFGVEEFN